MAAPTDLTATALSPNAIRLDWTNISSYTTITVQKYVSGSGWVDVGNVIPPTNETYTVSGLSPSTTYQFRLHTWEWEGEDLVEYYSNEAEATTYPTLSPPEDLEGFAYGDLIDLTWTAISLSADNIEIWRDSGSGYSLLATVMPNAESYRDATANTAGDYSYKLRAKQGTSYSDYSDPVTVTQYSTPSDVQNLAIASAGSNFIELEWDDPPLSSAPLAGYILEQYISGSYSEINRIPYGVNSTYIRGLEAETEYNFRIKSYNSKGTSSGQTISATTLAVNDDPALKLSNLIKSGRLDPVFALRIIGPGGYDVFFTSRAHSAFDTYTCYHDVLLPDNLNYEARLQPFWRPGLVGAGGNATLVNFSDTYFSTNNVMGYRARIYFGDASFTELSDFAVIGGGLISGVSIQPDKINISWEDPASVLNRQIYLSTDDNGNLIPKIYGSVYTRAIMTDYVKNKAKLCGHRIYEVTEVYQNDALIDPGDYVVDYERGEITFDTLIDFTEDDVIGVFMTGYRNLANEPINKASDVIINLCWSFRDYFNLSQLSYLRQGLTDTYNISAIISERENYIDVVRRIMGTAKLSSMACGDTFYLCLSFQNSGISYDSGEYSSLEKSIDIGDMVGDIIIRYGYASNIDDADSIQTNINGAPANAGELSLDIYGNSYLAGLIEGDIENFINGWTISIDLPFVPFGIEPGDIVSVELSDILVMEISAEMRGMTAKISGIVIT